MISSILVGSVSSILAITYEIKRLANIDNETPNVLFIICDDLNDAIEGFGGHPQAITPNINRLAEMGVKFSNAQSNCPICGPSRASLWSGLYPHTTGYYGYEQQKNHWRKNPILKNTVTLFEHMTNDGYKVFATGKIHHNDHEDWSIFFDKQGNSGFEILPSFGPFPTGKTEEYPGWGSTHPDMPESMQGTGWDSNFGPVRDISQSYDNSGFWLYKNNSSEIYHYRNENERDLLPDERSVMYAKKILTQNHKKPFMLAVGFNRPHSPLHVPEKYFNMYDLDTLKVTAILENDLDDCSKALVKEYDIGLGNYGFVKYNRVINAGGLETLKLWTQAYLACVTFVDEQLGCLLDALEKSPYAKNTIVVFTSDHGFHMGEKKQLFKNSVWEESTRVPLVIAGPEIQSSKICTAPVSLIDLYPTLVDYCKLSEEPNINTNKKPLDGYSLRELLVNPTENNWQGPEIAISALSSSKELNVNEPGKAEDNHFSIRSEQYRYIICRNGEEELYDHYSDPYEWNNLAYDKNYDTVKRELKKQFMQIIFN